MAEYHQNEARFYRYPMNRIVAIVDDDASLKAALAGLRQAGVDVSAVHVLSGQDGAALLDQTGESHGVRGRLLRLLQRGGYEADMLKAHSQALRAGRHVLYVPVGGDDQRRQVVGVLRGAGGYRLTHFRRWAIEQVR